jgi:N-hydroxyarylamine O-acetyltransferase
MVPHQINLENYAKRIGFIGAFKPDFATLAAIQNGHTCSIPFENLDVVRNLPIHIEPEVLEEKMIDQRRGGYCFEHNGLLLEVLSQIGFDAAPMEARVRIGNPRDYLPPRTHLFVLVKLNGDQWIVDGGVGGMSLTSPIKFELEIVQETLHEPRRITKENDVYFHQIHLGSEWEDVYEFSGQQMPMIDREVSNWWVSTCSKAKFKQNMFLALGRPDGERFGYLNGVFTHRKGAEILREITVSSDEHLLEVLKMEFGLVFPVGTDLGMIGCPWKLLPNMS